MTAVELSISGDVSSDDSWCLGSSDRSRLCPGFRCSDSSTQFRLPPELCCTGIISCSGLLEKSSFVSRLILKSSFNFSLCDWSPPRSQVPGRSRRHSCSSELLQLGTTDRPSRDGTLERAGTPRSVPGRRNTRSTRDTSTRCPGPLSSWCSC
ncbi:hypothetical protein L798_07214 [Zootermopsis nevadensis]|uniref:Uncharacterized protein n=1 Tax=Zootermopsis nevadensis TaxID=136037 RepID=A0A067RE60_ZOONE|nr:hypothetical protein L798_07214 [Zootermopsis nevadensis]